MQVQKGMSATESLLSVLADPAKAKAEFERLEGIRVDAEAAIAKEAEAKKEADAARAAAEKARSEVAAEEAAVKMLSMKSIQNVQEREAALLLRLEQVARKEQELVVAAERAAAREQQDAAVASGLFERKAELDERENRLVTWEKNLEVKELDLKNKLQQLRELAS